MISVRTIVNSLKSVPGMKAFMNLPGIRLVKNELGNVIDNFEIARKPDRRYFVDAIIPGLSKFGSRKLLFVGCREYTVPYYSMWTDLGIDCRTIDIDPVAARWGAPGARHVVGDILDADRLFGSGSFDAVIMNGVFGFGVETIDQMERALQAVSSTMREKGLLIVGWNTDKIADPANLTTMVERFRFCDGEFFPARKSFQSSTHIYDFYLKKAQ